MDYYYVLQNSWGALDGEHSTTNGLYSEEGGPCRPVALYCIETKRLMFTHSDPNKTPLSEELINWIRGDDEDNEYKILVSAVDDDMIDSYVDKINDLVADAGEKGVVNTSSYWYCHLDQEGQIVWHDQYAGNVNEIERPYSYNETLPKIGVTIVDYIISNSEMPFVTSFNKEFFLLPPNED